MIKSNKTITYKYSGNDSLWVLTLVNMLFIFKPIFLIKLVPKGLVKTSSISLFYLAGH